MPGHRVADPFKLTNGAGYTVSQGRGAYGEMIGYGHGAVDAELAVQMAQQWTTKNQALAPELTFTSFVTGPGNTPFVVPAAEKSNLVSGSQVVPGGITGTAFDGTFIDYWNEYFATDHVPFSQPNPPTNDRGGSIGFSVPDSNAMSIESVDVKLSFSADSNADEILNHLRIMLVSPDGTQSDLNNYFLDLPGAPFQFQILQTTNAFPVIGTPQIGGSGLAEFVWTFNTNRSWGERSDDAIIYDPVTQEPVLDQLGLFSSTQGTGSAMTQGWQLVLENWDVNDQFGLAGVEIAWHGSPIAAASQRVQGFVGVDDNRDDQFNYSRVIQTVGDIDGDPSTFRYGEVVNDIDLTQESFAANATVTVRRTSDNALVDQFVTGHDGNFYFDLVPDDYTITVEDSQGRTALDDASTSAQFLRHFKNTWTITKDWFNAWDHDANAASEVLVDPNGTPISWVDGNGQIQEYGMKGINFLLDPGPAPAPQVQFQGFVYADTNGDGVLNAYDVALPGVNVFGDVNRNGLRDSGEVTATTDATGHYLLTVPATQTAIINVGVLTPTGWTKTAPASGLQSFFVRPGDQIGGVDFRIKPPAVNNAGGGGASQPGILMGYVFEDVNGDGIQQTSEKGLGGVTVYIDANNSGVFDAGDTGTTTNQFGAYAFGNVAPGQRVLRTDVASPLVRTLPGNNGARIQTLVGSSTISGITFGVRNSAILDFGDLPSQYHATLATDFTVSAAGGARHRKGAYWLGATIDAELNGVPNVGADGDDSAGVPDDEDGIEFVTPLTPGTTATIKATASRNNGYLQAWADWNNDGDFSDAGERIITNRLLDVDASKNFIAFAVPGSAGAQVYMRFRYGEFATATNAINTPFGEAVTGEVEDYFRTVPALPAVIVGIPADFDQDVDVDGFDFLTWQRNAGRTTGASQSVGNANGDSQVDGNDLTEWKRDFGKNSASPLVLQTGDFNGDEDVDGDDFLALQRGYGATTGAFVTQGDGNGDRRVDHADMGIWSNAFGQAGLATTQANSGSVTLASASIRSFAAAALVVDDATAADSLQRFTARRRSFRRSRNPPAPGGSAAPGALHPRRRSHVDAGGGLQLPKAGSGLRGFVWLATPPGAAGRAGRGVGRDRRGLRRGLRRPGRPLRAAAELNGRRPAAIPIHYSQESAWVRPAGSFCAVLFMAGVGLVTFGKRSPGHSEVLRGVRADSSEDLGVTSTDFDPLENARP